MIYAPERTEKHTAELSATIAADAAMKIGTRTRAPSAELGVLIAKIVRY